MTIPSSSPPAPPGRGKSCPDAPLAPRGSLHASTGKERLPSLTPGLPRKTLRGLLSNNFLQLPQTLCLAHSSTKVPGVLACTHTLPCVLPSALPLKTDTRSYTSGSRRNASHEAAYTLGEYTPFEDIWTYFSLFYAVTARISPRRLTTQGASRLAPAPTGQDSRFQRDARGGLRTQWETQIHPARLSNLLQLLHSPFRTFDLHVRFYLHQGIRGYNFGNY